MRKLVTGLICILFLGFISNCGGGGGGGGNSEAGNGGTGNNPVADITGAWDVLGIEEDSSDTIVAFLNMADDGTVAGTAIQTNFTGTLDGNALSLTITKDTDTYTLTGEAASDGTKITGMVYYGTSTTGTLMGNFIAKKRADTVSGLYSPNFFAAHVQIQGDYAYVADGTGLRILDVSDPTDPVPTGRCDTMGVTFKVRVSGNFAYVLEERTGMKIIDITDKAAPKVVGAVFITRYASDLWLAGNYAYLLDDYTGLTIIDISDPLASQVVGHCNTRNWAQSMYVVGEHAYVGNSEGTTEIINISDPANPELLDGTIPGSSNTLVVRGNYAYVGTGSGSGLSIFNIEDLSDISFITYIPGIITADLWLSGNHLYIADENEGMAIVDVSTPDAPRYLGALPTDQSPMGIWSNGLYAYLACGDGGLEVMSIPDLTTNGLLATYTTTDSLDNFNFILVDDGVGYIQSGWGYDTSVSLLDVSNPAEIPVTEIGELKAADSSNGTIEVAVSEGMAYVLENGPISGALRIWNVSNPSAPIEQGSIELSNPEDIAVSGTMAYVIATMDDTVGLHVINLSNPDLPSHESTYAMEGLDKKVAANGTMVYLYNSSTLQILDLSIPGSPDLRGSLSIGTYNTDIMAGPDTVYLLDSYELLDDNGITEYATGLRVVDVSTPTAPVISGTYRWDSATRFFMEGTTAYLLNDSETFRVVDVSTPAAPVLKGSIQTPTLGWLDPLDMFIKDNRAYLALDDHEDKLLIIELGDLQQTYEKGAYTAAQSFAPNRIQVAGSTVYATSERHGFGVLDATDLGSIQLEGTIPVGIPEHPMGEEHASRFVVQDTHAYIAMWLENLQVVDVSQSSAPYVAGPSGEQHRGFDVDASGDYAYLITDFDSHLYVLNILNPEEPIEVEAIDLNLSAKALHVNDNRLYVLGIGGLLRIYNITDPRAVTLMGSADLDLYHADAIHVSSNTAYIADGSDGVAIANVEDATNPTLIAQFDPGDTTSVFAVGERLYASAGAKDGVLVFDVSDPTNPIPVDFFNTPGTAIEIMASGDYLYIADGVAGLRVLAR